MSFKEKTRHVSLIEGITLIAGIEIVFTIAWTFINGLLIKLVWNWLIPQLFHLPRITYWQAIGLYALFQLLMINPLLTKDK